MRILIFHGYLLRGAGSVSFDSPFDHFIAGEKNAIDDSAKRGWQLFNTKASCNKCHALTDTQPDVVNFMDYDFHNIGIGIIRHNVVSLARKAKQQIDSGDTAAVARAAIATEMSALGRFLVTKRDADIASFKTPNLRNVLATGPRFHDSSQETLWDVVANVQERSAATTMQQRGDCESPPHRH